MRHCDIPLQNSFKTKFLILVIEINCTSEQQPKFKFTCLFSKQLFFLTLNRQRYLPDTSPLSRPLIPLLKTWRQWMSRRKKRINQFFLYHSFFFFNSCSQNDWYKFIWITNSAGLINSYASAISFMGLKFQNGTKLHLLIIRVLPYLPATKSFIF